MVIKSGHRLATVGADKGVKGIVVRSLPKLVQKLVAVVDAVITVGKETKPHPMGENRHGFASLLGRHVRIDRPAGYG